jgi:hypothetical protein
LTDTGEAFDVYGVWPNLVKTSTLPHEGVTAHLIYGGDGEFSDFDGLDIEGSIVLMEFNSWNHWLNAAMLGATQIVFIEPDSTFTAQAKKTIGRS